jgi:arsenate reductase-like glutaredoxin family protein
MNAVKATALMLEYPALVKRPVFEIGPNVVVGFKDDVKKVLGLKI